MPVPIWLAVAALAAGTALQMSGQRKQREAQIDQAKYFRDRQRMLDDQAFENFQEALDTGDYERAQEVIADAAQRRISEQRDIVSEQNSLEAPDFGDYDSSEVLAKDFAQQIADRVKRTREGLDAQARADAFTDRAQDRVYEMRNFGNVQNLINNASRGNQNVFSQGTQLARSIGTDQQNIGNFLASLGMMGIGGNIGAGSAAGASAANNPAMTAALMGTEASYAPLMDDWVKALGGRAVGGFN
jgi:hypothetical protein